MTLHHWRQSFEGKIITVVIVTAIISAGISFTLITYLPLWVALPLTLLMVTLLALTLGRAVTGPIVRLLQALHDSTQNFKDRDFSITIASDRDDELGLLVESHNEVANILREERQNLYQKELLLETVFETTPVAMLLSDDGGRVLYGNVASREMLTEGRAITGLALKDLIQQLPAVVSEAIMQEVDGLISLELDGETRTYYVLNRYFTLNVRRQRLLQIREMTQEFRRQEVSTWKKVIRVISHELNNSLAPISSLAHSGKLALEKQDAKILKKILDTIADRSAHLKSFIEGYARFARLPKPNLEPVDLEKLMTEIEQQYPVEVIRKGLDSLVCIDAVQIEQVLINLIKNAMEANPGGHISVRVCCNENSLEVFVCDRGAGMSRDVLENALLPFYSTKQNGTGLGLALCREIIEAHNGVIDLKNPSEGGLEVRFNIPLVSAG
jgi:two-component system nitrogen regulation sensor histidine kinase NtrY